MYLYNNYLTEDYNPSYTGKQSKHVYIKLWGNKFTFNGLEYLVEKYGNNVTDTPQANISIHSYENKLAVSAGGTLTNNTYT